MHGLITTSASHDVASTFQKHVYESNVWSVLEISNAEGRLNSVIGHSEEQNEEVCKGLVVGKKDHSLVLIHQALDCFNTRQLNEEPLAKRTENLAGTPDKRTEEALVDRALHTVELLIRLVDI